MNLLKCGQGSLIGSHDCVSMEYNPSEIKSQLSANVRRLAYLYSPEDKFTLASGRESPHFFDMKPVMMDPECAHLLGIMIHQILVEMGDIDAVGGLELGAVPLTGIVIAKSGKGSNLRGFIVRKEPKWRGGRKTGNPPGIEGSTVLEGDRVVLLEDVTTTGGSAIKCANMLENIGCNVVGCVTILDREEGGVSAFHERGIPLFPLLTKSDVAGN